ncbi:amidohydrolase family protein [Neorhodopirellula pilleata]|uniref:D-hydantoinase/dihydropyrimidinase n=1 Tax=Neorhodopirellula pilleata TaxID=2714738 RepID=A0A5C6ABC3_9BACT|nr:amidohydrolase family protein [Neorhodopirellula pilleata]TWT97304.1 D-hydantoinase/dihydropyrimidinase [Neorhodopirellula pilleata]
MLRCVFPLSLLWLVLFNAAVAQSTVPVVGLRSNPVRTVVLQNATVVTQPGETLTAASIVIENEQIIAVGPEIEIPPGAEVIDCTAKTIYPGLIDGFRELSVDWPEQEGSYWNANVTPRRHAGAAIAEAQKAAGDYRKQGITLQVLAPSDRIIQGQSVVMLCRDSTDGSTRFADTPWQHLQLTVPRNRTSGESYPNSPMGAVALLRQSFYDAIWYRDAWRAYQANPRLTRPETNLDLETLAESLEQQTWVIDAPNERMGIRGCDLADEFSFDVILRGSGYEYQAIEELASRNRPVLLPIDFPKPPSVNNDASAREVDLRTMMHWHFAPQNPRIVNDAGIEFCFTSEGLDQVGSFLKNVRRAVAEGLPADVALAALTTRPARWLGVDEQLGSLRPGHLANLLITDGDLFAKDTKILETWVAGSRYEHSPDLNAEPDPLVGQWDMDVTLDGQKTTFELNIRDAKQTVSMELTRPEPKPKGKKKTSKQDEPKPKPIALRNVVRHRDQLTGLVSLADLTKLADTPLADTQAADTKLVKREFAEGIGSLELTSVATAEATSSDVQVSGKLVSPDGKTVPVKLTRRKTSTPSETTDEPEKETKSDESDDANKPNREIEPQQTDAIVINHPLGGFGFVDRPEQPETVLFRGATVWTCDQGQPSQLDVLVRSGKIADIGTGLKPPPGCQIVDVKGKHLTPGMIDCHSHMATDGGINESGQAVTAEVRIVDFLDNTDITIYRQLAGGVTTANMLHGSANPIGGQNQVIKLRWGGRMSELRFHDAPAGIKFALGENVKRSSSRYPNTRMGVEQLLRDQFLAAREYLAAHRRYAEGDRSMLPPRRDLQLEAIAEIQNHERWIHCHSYRQDEIIATLDVLDEFGIRIGSLQHILEGYKVADRMARHGAMASSFADWWAYKFEVFDAIPYNGVLMHNAGIVVSYNSDDPELGRHLNTEAAKAVKYGGVDPVEALKFVTLNPAKQLRIDDRVGSIEVGKDADVVVWSGPPLSTTSRCEQTWIDGRRYFDLETDRQMRQRDQVTRARLIQLIRTSELPPELSGKSDGKNAKEQQDEADRWLRFDEFCTAKGQ